MTPLRYSAIDTAYTCSYLYKLKYVDGEKFPESNSFDAEFGTAIHLALQAHWNGEEAQTTFQMYWNMFRDAELVRFRFDWAYLAEAGPVMIDKWLKFHAKKYEPKCVEKELRAKIGKYEFTGTPDFVGLYNGIPSIVDYKAYSKEISVLHLLSNEQMYIYAEMAKQTLGYEVKQIAYVGFIKPEKRIQSNRRLVLTEEKLTSMLVNVEHMATDLMTRTVFPKNRHACTGFGPGGCEAFSKCYPGQLQTKEQKDE